MSPSHAEIQGMDTTPLALRVTGKLVLGPQVAHRCDTARLGRHPRRGWVGCWDESPFAICSVGVLIARPVVPQGDSMPGPQEASCTMSSEVLCHTAPGPARGARILAQTHTSEPARSPRGFPLRREVGSLAHGTASDKPLMSGG